ncbi:diacylglycerol acyltransferase [Mrakia frigida]|uniref:diacylglycerol O-acyltransferase n=1 Tax=Mrakia frigida TaxID=29902 RepID=UPI003FCC0F1E
MAVDTTATSTSLDPLPASASIPTLRPSRSKSPLVELSSSISELRGSLVKSFKAQKIPQVIEIKFAPLKVPRNRRLQTASVALWSTLLPICVSTFFFCCSIPLLWPILILYLIWIFKIDRAAEHGGRPKKWFRKQAIWRHFSGYYPVSCIQEATLPPDRPYIFGYHPHGVIGMGAFSNFATEGTGFSKNFPGIRPHLLTLAANFQIPFYRDIILLLGMSSVSKRSCSNILRKGPGEAIVIVIGGATESLRAHPGTADLTLKRRLGFIKIAIREGADLVPVFSFGENDIYDQLANERGTTIYKVQKVFQSIFGFTLPMFHGRGLFNYNLGLMPYRHPIVSVVGRPISVTQADSPSPEQMLEVQKAYIEELLRIWETYKDVYARNRTRELTIVE